MYQLADHVRVQIEFKGNLLENSEFHLFHLTDERKTDENLTDFSI